MGVKHEILAEDKRKRIGASHPLYRGGTHKDANGYIILDSLAFGENSGRREHRVVMEQHLGRPLNADEIVHHINGDKADNRIENLSVETRASHNRKHVAGRLMQCSDCGAERWYSPYLISKLSTRGYKCRRCRFGKDWKNK